MTDAKPPRGGYIQRDCNRHPPAHVPGYKTSVTRSPQKALLSFPSTLSEETGPLFRRAIIGPRDNDLLHNHAAAGESAIGPRILVYGQVRDQSGQGLPDTLLEVWQANAGGRYRHRQETYLAPLDPNFGGCGRCLTDARGFYEFRSVMPGPYPWPNGVNDWRPSHIHFSLFGQAFAQRLITQMYFEGDPLIWKCPIVNTIPSRPAIEDLIAVLDLNASLPMDTLAYRFDITLRGRRQTYFENRPEGL